MPQGQSPRPVTPMMIPGGPQRPGRLLLEPTEMAGRVTWEGTAAWAGPTGSYVFFPADGTGIQVKVCSVTGEVSRSRSRPLQEAVWACAPVCVPMCMCVAGAPGAGQTGTCAVLQPCPLFSTPAEPLLSANAVPNPWPGPGQLWEPLQMAG